LRRIAEAVRERQELVGEPSSNGVPDDALAVVFVNGPGVGWGNGGFRNGGFYNGGFRNGGFYNGGFRNGGFSNGGFRNGGFLNHW
jgi:rSAM-associated Gly-rich repeat protein